MLVKGALAAFDGYTYPDTLSNTQVSPFDSFEDQAPVDEI